MCSVSKSENILVRFVPILDRSVARLDRFKYLKNVYIKRSSLANRTKMATNGTFDNRTQMCLICQTESFVLDVDCTGQNCHVKTNGNLKIVHMYIIL